MGNCRLLIVLIVLPLVFLSCSSDTKTLKVSAKSVDFGPIYIADTDTRIITLTNKYGKDLNITTIGLTGSTDFIIISGGTVPIFLEKNQTHDIEVQFAPSSSGILDALMSIKHDLSEKTKDVEFTGEGVPVPRIDLSDTTYDFGTVYVSVHATHDFVVSNIGTSVLNVTNIALIGPSANLYSITTGNAPFTVSPGATKTFTLQFSPLADGTFPISVEIAHDAVNESSPISIPIDAKGVTFAPEIKFSESTPWDIGQHSTGAPSVHDLVITSDGIDPLTITSASFVTAAEFSVKEFQDKNANVVNLPQTIQPGDTLTIKIEFAPTANQKYNDTLTIVHDGINEITPFDFSIEGEGRIPVVKTFSYTGAIENWQVPAGVTKVTIEVWGAQGARSGGGKGAYMKGDFTVSPGDTLKVLVGQKGKDGDNTRTYLGGGGGGGSFVCKSNNDPMIIAGGGGGYTNYGSTTTMDGRATTDGGDTYSNGGGNNGQGGQNGSTNGPAAGGGGLLTNGGDYSGYCYGGKSFLNGGAGGAGTTSYDGGDGGFGGGGGGYCRSNIYNRSGGGGGYSGGQGGTWSGQQSGGGGGSYNDGSNKTETGGTKTGDGEIKITY